MRVSSSRRPLCDRVSSVTRGNYCPIDQGTGVTTWVASSCENGVGRVGCDWQRRILIALDSEWVIPSLLQAISMLSPPYSGDVCSYVLFSTHHFVPAGSKLPMFAIIPPLQYRIIIHLAICHSLNQSAAHEISENSNISVCMNMVWDFQLPGGDASHLLTITGITYIGIRLYSRTFMVLSPFVILCRP